MHEQIDHILLTEEEINTKVRELAEQLSRDYEGKNPVFVGVLKGVVLFYSDIVRRFAHPCQLDFLRISSYEGTESTGQVKMVQGLSQDITGRHIVILEDIFDTGKSLDFTYHYLQSLGAASVEICTFLDKPERRNPDVTLKPKYVGYVIPNEFVVGYGLDYNEYFRNLPYIGVLKPEVYEN